jgi:uncharacterized protein YaiE (UPF0345 family)
MPATSGTLALVSQLTGGTVTSVGLSSATSGVTIGSSPITTSGTITLAIATASGSQQGLLSSTDWTTFNNKQSALTNPVTGTGTTNYLPKFTGTSTIGNSGITDDNTTVTYGAGSGLKQIYINGGGYDLILGASGGGVFGFTSTNISLVFSTTAKPLGIGTNAAQPLIFGTSAAERMRLDASGNLGLGVTPSAWSAITALELANGVSIASYSAAAIPNSYLTNNAFYNGSNWIYKVSSFAATMQTQTSGGNYAWNIAPSGTAGNAISFTQAMTLTANGDLGVGTTSPNYSTSGRKVIAVDGSSSAIFALQNSGTSAGYLYGDGGNVILWAEGSRNLQLGGASTGSIYFTPNNSNAMIITSGGSVGIGTTSPSRILTIYNTSAATLYQTPTSGTGANDGFYVGQTGDVSYVWNYNNFPLAFGTNNTERMRITSGGNLLVGKSTNAGGKLQVSNGTITFNVDYNADGAYLTAATDNNVNYRRLSYDATDHVFLTSATERMRITSGGAVRINSTTDINSRGVALQVSGTETAQLYGYGNGYGIGLFMCPNSAATGTHTAIAFRSPANGDVGTITTTSSATAYNTSSDYRLKTDYKDFSGLDLVSKIKAYNYEWKADKTRAYGVIAHELQSVINYAVTGVKDGEQMQGVDYSKIVPVLIKAIQELNDKIK